MSLYANKSFHIILPSKNMAEMQSSTDTYNETDPMSIYDFSRHLIGHSLRSLLGSEITSKARIGKGGLGQMVEELFFKYEVNSCRDADFAKAQVELKCTPLLKSKHDSYRVKERLVCTMIDYFEIVDTTFEESHLLSKCQLMLILFYLHVADEPIYDYEFLFRVLWQIPEKDLIIIKNDYKTIADKVKRGEAHLLSEGDTLYLGACRKGQKGDSLRSQPFSDEKAKRRAFCLKPAYMRYLLSHVVESGRNFYTNYAGPAETNVELVSCQELKEHTFENVILERFAPFMKMRYTQICERLGISPYQSKCKYADVAALIASDMECKKLSKSDEFIKSGIIMKTVRLNAKGVPKESMSFKNIDYCEVYENDEWTESDAYELFTNRFMFVVFREVDGENITFYNEKTNSLISEKSYVLDSVFFWTMPQSDLEYAKLYWENIRQAVLSNQISAKFFWSLKDRKKFHVRPKAGDSTKKAVNPHGGLCSKYCYWFNADYVKQIIETCKKL